MTKKQAIEIYNYWVAGAKDSCDTAKFLFDGGRFMHALFFCHLTIEKMLKAIVVKKTGEHAPYDHNLAALLTLSGLDFSQEQINSINEINTFNISGRYDTYKMEFYKKATQDYSKKYFNEAMELYIWLLSKI